MYSELTPRVLVGGFVSPRLDVDFLDRAGVTHLVNASKEVVPEVVENQFWTLHLPNSEHDVRQTPAYWAPLFAFTRRAMRHRSGKIYFHVSQSVDSPVACYAALLAIGYGRFSARRRLDDVHPVCVWHEHAMRSVDDAFRGFVKVHKRIRYADVPKEMHETEEASFEFDFDAGLPA